MPAVETQKIPTYGNWRRPDSGGIGNLSSLVTMMLVIMPIFAILIFIAFGWSPPLIGYVLICAVTLVLFTIKDRHNRTTAHRIGARVGHTWARVSGGTAYRSGPLSRIPWGQHQLPGLLAQSRLSEAIDSYGRPFALIYMPSSRHYTVVLATDPDGMSLVDQSHIDNQVSYWGQWLANLAHEPGMAGASVTIETAPDSGTRLRREVASNIAEDAPELAKAMFAEVIDRYPSGSALTRAYIALTYRADSKRRRNAEAMAHELASRLPALTAGLSEAGAGTARPLPAQELCETIRMAYDPASTGLIEQAKADSETPDLEWSEVGPVAFQTGWDLYRHDSGVSRTWEMTLPPRGEVYSDVLQRLLGPVPSCDRKRVTMIYQPYDPAKAAQTVEADKDAADFRVSTSNRPSARAQAAAGAAKRMATEEARGAGVVEFAMLVTATVSEAERMDDAAAAIENLSAGARVRLRTVYGAQDSAFAAALPLGLILPAHVRVPAQLRGAL